MLSVVDMLDCTASHLRGVSDALSYRMYTRPDDMDLALRALIDVSTSEIDTAISILQDTLNSE